MISGEVESYGELVVLEQLGMVEEEDQLPWGGIRVAWDKVCLPKREGGAWLEESAGLE
uniref:Uncharacterized protein n=1 Tax=Fagus sylvatica TaxID=28930 RepID=A0A2N9H9R2_FAGSY